MCCHLLLYLTFKMWALLISQVSDHYENAQAITVSNGIQYKSGQLCVFAVFSNNVQVRKQAETVTKVVTGLSLIGICLKFYHPSEQVPACCTSRWLLPLFSKTHLKLKLCNLSKESVFHLS